MQWREILKNNFTKWETLCDFLELELHLREKILKKSSFPLNLPLRLASKIEKNTLSDPILRQFVPLLEENETAIGFCQDPLDEALFSRTSKFLHKYQGRALLLPTSACAMHCRFCFRRHFPYDASDKSLEKELKLIANDPSLNEIILSGGDPLSLGNETLKSLLKALEAIPHVRRVRLHTRFPIGIPERLEPALLDLFEDRKFQVWMVLHCNHANELDEEVIRALKNVHKRGVVLLNQAVLLKGVNDSIEALADLCEKLANCGILAYYLHQLDRVDGAHHFEVEEQVGLALIEELQKRTSGYAVPRYVREIAGQPSKTLVTSSPGSLDQEDLSLAARPCR